LEVAPNVDKLGVKDTRKVLKLMGQYQEILKADAKMKLSVGIIEKEWPQSAISKNTEEIEELAAKRYPTQKELPEVIGGIRSAQNT